MYYVYVLQSLTNQSYYKGHTHDLLDRLRRHNNGEENYTVKHDPWELKWCCTKASKAEAYRLEMKLKNLSRERLEAFMEKYKDEELLQRFRP